MEWSSDKKIDGDMVDGVIVDGEIIEGEMIAGEVMDGGVIEGDALPCAICNQMGCTACVRLIKPTPFSNGRQCRPSMTRKLRFRPLGRILGMIGLSVVEGERVTGGIGQCLWAVDVPVAFNIARIDFTGLGTV